MTVYVDDMRAPFRRMLMCHMVADSDEELHAMADRIGVARKWFQGDHYDVCVSKRTLAIKLGAQQITWRECGRMVMARRRAQAAARRDLPMSSDARSAAASQDLCIAVPDIGETSASVERGVRDA